MTEDPSCAATQQCLRRLPCADAGVCVRARRQMFDEDRSGAIDEDEFYFALEYLGLKVSDQKQEGFFKKYDKDNSGTIDYEEFMAIWLEVGRWAPCRIAVPAV